MMRLRRHRSRAIAVLVVFTTPRMIVANPGQEEMRSMMTGVVEVAKSQIQLLKTTAAAGEFSEAEHAAIAKIIDASIKDLDAIGAKSVNGASLQEVEEAVKKAMAPVQSLASDPKYGTELHRVISAIVAEQMLIYNDPIKLEKLLQDAGTTPKQLTAIRSLLGEMWKHLQLLNSSFNRGKPIDKGDPIASQTIYQFEADTHKTLRDALLQIRTELTRVQRMKFDELATGWKALH